MTLDASVLHLSIVGERFVGASCTGCKEGDRVESVVIIDKMGTTTELARSTYPRGEILSVAAFNDDVIWVDGEQRPDITEDFEVNWRIYRCRISDCQPQMLFDPQKKTLNPDINVDHGIFTWAYVPPGQPEERESRQLYRTMAPGWEPELIREGGVFGGVWQVGDAVVYNAPGPNEPFAATGGSERKTRPADLFMVRPKETPIRLSSNHEVNAADARYGKAIWKEPKFGTGYSIWIADLATDPKPRQLIKTPTEWQILGRGYVLFQGGGEPGLRVVDWDGKQPSVTIPLKNGSAVSMVAAEDTIAWSSGKHQGNGWLHWTKVSVPTQ